MRRRVRDTIVSMSEVGGTAVGAEEVPAEQKYTRNNPYYSTVVTNYLLSGEGSEKETRHLAFALEEGMSYAPGDYKPFHHQNCVTHIDQKDSD